MVSTRGGDTWSKTGDIVGELITSGVFPVGMATSLQQAGDDFIYRRGY
jgi:hypothetical protein